MVRIIAKRNLELAPFADEVHDMADFVKAYPQILGEDVVIVSRDLEHGPDGRRLDFFVYDTEFEQPGIVELKKDHADEKALLQALRYADWLRNNPDTIRYHISRLDIQDVNPDEVDVEKLKVFIVAPKIDPVVAGLSQYISGFDFEFIQLQRFKDSNGETYAVTNPLDVQSRAVSPTRQRLEHDVASYAQRGVSQEQLNLLESAVVQLNNICVEEGWELSPRYLKNHVKFQTGGGRNVFWITIRKEIDHHMRFCLGPDFDPKSVEIDEQVREALQPKAKKNWWSLPLTTAPVERYRSLLRTAYVKVVG